MHDLREAAAGRRRCPRGRSPPPGRVTARRVLLATSAYPPLLRAIRRYIVPVYDYVLMTEPLTPAQRASIGWRAPPGHRRLGQPVPLLPPDRRRSHPLRRLGRGLPLRRPGLPPPRRPRPDLREALPALLPHLPAARRPALHPPLGRRDRHVLALLGLLRPRLRRQADLRHRLHRPRRRRGPLRRPHRTRPARRPRHRSHPPALRPRQARPLPARTAALRGRPIHPRPPRRRRPQPRPPRPLAPPPGPPGPRLRFLTRFPRRHGAPSPLDIT